MKAHFQLMARYNQWVNRRLYEQARGLTDEQYRRPVGAFFGSLHGTLNHILVGDRIWMRRFTGTGDAPAKLNAILHDDLASLERAREEEDARILRYVDGLSDPDCAAELEYKTTAGVPYRNVLGQLLAHFFNHQTHHRGQAHMILTVLGIAEPKSQDLLGLLREKASA